MFSLHTHFNAFSSGMDAKFLLTESHDMKRPAPRSFAVALSPSSRSTCLKRVAPFIIENRAVATRSRTDGALLLFSSIGQVLTRWSRNPPVLAN